jgi:hypothetical protein
MRGELTKDAVTLAVCLWADGPINLCFTSGGLIHHRALAAIHNLVECGFLVVAPETGMLPGMVGWRCTPSIKRFIGRPAPKPEDCFPLMTEETRICH